MDPNMTNSQGYPNQMHNSQFPGQSFNPSSQFLNNVPNQDMINMGVSAGTKIIEDKMHQYMPGANRFWHSLKEYFLVLHSPFSFLFKGRF